MTGGNTPYRPGTSSIWKWIGPSAKAPEEKPSPKALADLKRRQAMGERSDLTGRMLGDPPPGRSALEQKLEAERRRAEALAALEQANEENGDG
jgi:hypothetical protein